MCLKYCLCGRKKGKKNCFGFDCIIATFETQHIDPTLRNDHKNSKDLNYGKRNGQMSFNYNKKREVNIYILIHHNLWFFIMYMVEFDN